MNTPSFLQAPQNCLLCHDSHTDQAVCTACQIDLTHLARPTQQHCPQCGSRGNGLTPCGRCQKKPPPFNRLHISYTYQPPLSGILHQFKHHRQIHLAAALCQLMSLYPPSWLKQAAPDTVLAMPLSRARRIERGFNQCDLLADGISYHFELPPPLAHHTVYRRPTPPQSTLPYKQRRQNVQRIFHCPRTLTTRRILIIDDVLTTGSTLTELARTLKQAGAAEIYAWILAQAGR